MGRVYKAKRKNDTSCDPPSLAARRGAVRRRRLSATPSWTRSYHHAAAPVGPTEPVDPNQAECVRQPHYSGAHTAH
eukprot:5207258-Prymnesium_polylepis.1